MGPLVYGYGNKSALFVYKGYKRLAYTLSEIISKRKQVRVLLSGYEERRKKIPLI